MYDAPTLEEAESALRVLDSSDTEVWIKVAGALKHEFDDDAEQVWIDWSSNYSGFNEKECRTRWKSIKTTGSKKTATIATLFYLAREAGWTREVPKQSPEEKAAAAKRQAERVQQQAERDARERAEIHAWHERVSSVANEIWESLAVVGSSRYLGAKKVGANGGRFFNRAVLFVTHEDHLEVVEDPAAIKAFFDLPKESQQPFHFFKRGYFVLPLRDVAGKIWALQVITPSGKKMFMRNARKSGLFCALGEAANDRPLVLVEGFATGASVYEATKSPVWVCLDCHNLKVVADSARKAFPEAPIIMAADDDYATEGNPGVTCATEAAESVGGYLWMPERAEDKKAAA